METSATSLPERKPAPQAHLLTNAAELGRRIRGESLEHYVHAVMRTIEDFLAHLPETAGMDLRMALAIFPSGQPLVNIEFRPDRLPPAVVGDLGRRIESLARPPVRQGPVAFLAFWLVRGGSDDPRNSFRHAFGPYFRVECPHRFAAAVNQAEAALRPRPLPRWQVLWKKAGRLAAQPRAALRRAWSALFSAPASSASKPSARYCNLRKGPCNVRDGPCKLPEDQSSLDDITAQIQRCPDCGYLHALRARVYSNLGKFDLAIADYTRQIEMGTEVPQAHLARGVCYRMTEKQDKALDDFNEAVWRRPRWAEAIIARAWTYQAMGKMERAFEDAALAIELEPEEPNWLVARTRLSASVGMFDKAMADLNHALALDPHHSDALFLRASVYRDRPCPVEQAKADFEASLADFTAVLYLHPGHAESYASRASIRMRFEDEAGTLADCTRRSSWTPSASWRTASAASSASSKASWTRRSRIFRPASAWRLPTPPVMRAVPRPMRPRTAWRMSWPIAAAPSRSTPAMPRPMPCGV